MDGCIFCRILQGDGEAAVAYEDDAHICIMDRHPINPGHVLVVPKKHYATLFEMPPVDVGKLFILVAKVAKTIASVMNADGINIGQNNGIAARQRVFHVHVHVIPRYSQDTSAGHFPTRREAEIDELKRTASLIQSDMTGTKQAST